MPLVINLFRHGIQDRAKSTPKGDKHYHYDSTSELPQAGILRRDSITIIKKIALDSVLEYQLDGVVGDGASQKTASAKKHSRVFKGHGLIDKESLVHAQMELILLHDEKQTRDFTPGRLNYPNQLGEHLVSKMIS